MVGATAVLAGIVVVPLVIPSLNNIGYRDLVWSIYGIFVVATLISVALIPYFGMRAMKKEVEAELLKAKFRINTLQPLQKLKQNQMVNPNSYIAIRFDSIQITPKEEWAYLYGVVNSQLLFEWQIKGIRAVLSLGESTELYVFEGDGITIPALSNFNKSNPFYVKCCDESVIQMLKEQMRSQKNMRIRIRGKVEFKTNGAFFTVTDPINDDYLRPGQAVELTDGSNTPKEIAKLLKNASVRSPGAL